MATIFVAKTERRMIVVPNKNEFYTLKSHTIRSLVLKRDDVFEFVFDDGKSLSVDMALLRIHDGKKLLLSGWETMIGKDNRPFFDGESLASSEMMGVSNLLKDGYISKITVTKTGDLLMKLSTGVYIDVLINCFCKDSYYYKLNETEVKFCD